MSGDGICTGCFRATTMDLKRLRCEFGKSVTYEATCRRCGHVQRKTDVLLPANAFVEQGDDPNVAL